MKRMSLLISCLLWLFPAGLSAYTFSPSLITLAPYGNNSSAMYTLINTGDRIIPIDITIYELSKDIDGKTIQGMEVLDNFIVYPSQLLLKPNEKRSVQVRWVGDPSIPHEQSFTIFSREVPLPKTDAKKKKSEGATSFIFINVLMNYAGRLYVTPEDAKPEIIIDSVVTRRNELNKPELVITCRNDGTRRGNLKTRRFMVTPVNKGMGQKVELTLENVPGMASSILVNGKRRYIIPWPEEIPFGPVKVILK